MKRQGTLNAQVCRVSEAREYWFEEGCFIQEVANDSGDSELSIARARVPGKGETCAHMLRGVSERYVVIAGRGRVEVGDLPPEDVGPGDVVRIPAETRQRIINLLDEDLIFLVVCSPPFRPDCYHPL